MNPPSTLWTGRACWGADHNVAEPARENRYKSADPVATTPIILASASPRRRELLERVGIAIAVVPADVDETAHPGEPAIAYARRVALAKANTIAGREPDRWVVAADTVVEVDGDILGKAADEVEARAMLARLLGRTHRVTTAVAIIGPGSAAIEQQVTTAVTMRAAGDDELRGYVASGEWRGKAGAYAVQGMAAAFVTRVEGSITNVIGLPLAEVVCELARLGAAVPHYPSGDAA